MTADRDREAFEAWCAATFGPNWATHIWSPERDMCRKTWQSALTHARAQAGEPVAAGAWTREDLAAGLAELDGIDLVPPLKSVVDLEYLNRADDLLTFLSVASAANEPLGAIHPAPAQEPVVPAGWKMSVSESDGRTWLNLRTPYGASVDLSVRTHHGDGKTKTIGAQVLEYFRDAIAAPVSPPAESGKREKLSETIKTRLLGVEPDEQDVILEDDDWRMILAALASTPAQEPGSEPRGCPTPGACSCAQPGGAVKVKARSLDLATMLKHAWIAGKTGTAWEDYDPTELVVYQRLAETLDIPIPTPPAGEG